MQYLRQRSRTEARVSDRRACSTVERRRKFSLAFSDAVLGFFDVEQRQYERVPIDEQVEVVSFVGDVTCDAKARKVHAHVVVAKRDGTAHGGHLLCAHVRPTLEVVVTESPTHLHRETDAATGLALIKIEPRRN
jgi:predicted DNA-binding protein with PD1-like motif